MFHRLKIRSKATNVAEINRKSIGKCQDTHGLHQRGNPTWGHLWSSPQMGTLRLGVVRPQ